MLQRAVHGTSRTRIQRLDLDREARPRAKVSGTKEDHSKNVQSVGPGYKKGGSEHVAGVQRAEESVL